MVLERTRLLPDIWASSAKGEPNLALPSEKSCKPRIRMDLRPILLASFATWLQAAGYAPNSNLAFPSESHLLMEVARYRIAFPSDDFG